MPTKPSATDHLHVSLPVAEILKAQEASLALGRQLHASGASSQFLDSYYANPLVLYVLDAVLAVGHGGPKNLPHMLGTSEPSISASAKLLESAGIKLFSHAQAVAPVQIDLSQVIKHFRRRYFEKYQSYPAMAEKKAHHLLQGLLAAGISATEIVAMIDFCFNNWNTIKAKLSLNGISVEVIKGYWSSLTELRAESIRSHESPHGAGSWI